jgi:hypothetical protein
MRPELLGDKEDFLKIRRGTTRAVIRVGKYILKFPRITGTRIALKDTFGSFRRKEWKEFKNNLRGHLHQLLQGIIANLTEFTSYLVCRSSFLEPVVSVGIVSVQRCAGDEIPDRKELEEVLKSFPPEIWKILYLLDPHALDTPNWRKVKSGYRLIDYGDSFAEMPLSYLLIHHHQELSRLLGFASAAE